MSGRQTFAGTEGQARATMVRLQAGACCASATVSHAAGSCSQSCNQFWLDGQTHLGMSEPAHGRKGDEPDPPWDEQSSTQLPG